MARHTLIALATVFVLGVSGAVPGDNGARRGVAALAARPDDAPTLVRTVVLDGLTGPWDLAFTPDGALLYTEKCRGLSVRRADGARHVMSGRVAAFPVWPRGGGRLLARLLRRGPERGAWRRGRSRFRAHPPPLPVHALHPLESTDQPRRAPRRGPRLHDGQCTHRYCDRPP